MLAKLYYVIRRMEFETKDPTQRYTPLIITYSWVELVQSVQWFEFVQQYTTQGEQPASPTELRFLGAATQPK